MNSVMILLGGQGLPRGDCLLWEASLVWLHVLSDAFIALAYYTIPVALVYFIRQRSDMAFQWMFLLFGAFIFACGTTHLLGIWTLWQPVYWLEGLVKACTATTSVAAAVLLVSFIPKALGQSSPAQLAAANHALQAEVAERERAEAALRALTNTLEQRVEERTTALARVNDILQAEMDERQRMEAELRAALHDKEMLLREIHHRVKNNLQVVLSLLDLQADVAEDPRVRTAFEESQDRIQAMALIHESLYQSDGLSPIDAAAYLRSLSQRLFDASRAPKNTLTLTLETQPVMLPPQTAMPCGLLLNELLSNALKHAFPGGRAGTIHIALQQEPPGQCILTVQDTGVGFPEGLDVHHANSLGLQLVGLLTEQLGGTVALRRDGGTIFMITFPV